MTWNDAYAHVGICPDDLRMWRMVLRREAQAKPQSTPQSTPKIVGLPPALYSPGKGWDKHRLSRVGRIEVVNGKMRDRDWGKGRAAAEFDRLRRERARIKKGHAVEYDIRTQLGLPVDHLLIGSSP